MKRVDLAASLGISPTMVRRLERRGMPVDSTEAARRWRARNLDSLRTKQFRVDGNTGQHAVRPLQRRGGTPTQEPSGRGEADMLRSAQLFCARFGIERFGPLLVHLGCVMSEEGHDVIQQAIDRGEQQPDYAIADDDFEAASAEYFAWLPPGCPEAEEVQFGGD